ncbi:Triosephosphate isomerase [Ferriphaselus amnicola]|uniref:Triosephosphate isomerase n=1 Tax=Ferriphaselus amnicola TaxID=1188319 RepID=A0A2Z6GD54_9PROT|nr:triose-phosphate isomerase [Ferriphaselus amnicola]BBE51380.1 Triosephosphate isomerase [Ferriphaselus amnicola]
MRRKFVAGNWKMHGSMVENAALLNAVIAGMSQLNNVDCAVCVPYPYLAQAQNMLTGSNIMWGAQDVHQLEKGAYTGEVSAEMLKDFGCRYAIVGHSERRAIYGESNLIVAGKFAAAQNAKLVPILCVGETLDDREAGHTESVVAAQLDIVIEMCGVHALRNCVLAYEPVWAIGTGKTASPEQAQAVHAFIRNRVAGHDASVAERLIIQYGGSVKPSNAVELFSMPDIDGGLIGGAALVAEDFLAICRAGN